RRGKLTSNASNCSSTWVIGSMSPGHGIKTVTCGGRSFAIPTFSTRPGNGTASANSAIRRFEADERGADQPGRGAELRAHHAHPVAHRPQRLPAQHLFGRPDQMLP